jgi:Gas vesicle synthesis protein GvpL/GvpF
MSTKTQDKTQDVWVYGVVPAGSSLATLDSRSDKLPDVWLVEVGDLAAIVSDVPGDDAKATRDQALAHARVLEAAVEDAPVVPLKFGTVCPGDEQVGKGLLEERHDELAEVLKRVEGHVQMTLKVTYDEQAVLREIVDSEPEIGRLREATSGSQEEDASYNDRVRLGELVNTALEQRRERDSADILEALKSVAASAVVEPLEQEFMVLNAPFLVERKRTEEFEAAVDEVAEARSERMHFRLLGPMPAYHFLEAEQPAWA